MKVTALIEDDLIDKLYDHESHSTHRRRFD